MKLICKKCDKKVSNGFVLHPVCYNKLMKEIKELNNLSFFFIKNKRTRIGMVTIQKKLQRLEKEYEKE